MLPPASTLWVIVVGVGVGAAQGAGFFDEAAPLVVFIGVAMAQRIGDAEQASMYVPALPGDTA